MKKIMNSINNFLKKWYLIFALRIIFSINLFTMINTCIIIWGYNFYVFYINKFVPYTSKFILQVI